MSNTQEEECAPPKKNEETTFEEEVAPSDMGASKPRQGGSLRLSRNASVNASLNHSLKNWNIEMTEEGESLEAGSAKQPHHLGCGILGHYPVTSILVFAAAGIAAGIGLSHWSPENEADASNKASALQWIGLIGDLFIRALKTVV